MVQRVIRWVGKDKTVKDELSAWEGQDYPQRRPQQKLEDELKVCGGAICDSVSALAKACNWKWKLG